VIKLAEIKKLLSFLKGKKVAITTHRHADIDAIVSSYVVKRHVEKNGGKAKIVIYEGLNYDAESLVEDYNIEYQKVDSEEELDEFDEIIVVDTQSIEQIELMKNKKAYIVIDHHERSATLIRSEHYFVNANAVANAQHILWLLELDKLEKELVAIAIISDTYRFKRFDKRSALEFAKLLNEIDKDYTFLLKKAFPNRDKRSKLNILDALRNSNYREEGNYLISYTITKDNTGEIASILTTFSDVALVMKKNDNGKTSMSLRCNEFFPFALNKIAERIGKEIGGAGGGHKKAAGALLEKPPEEAIEKAVKIIIEEIRKG